jgi:hypothetical protein
MGHTGSLKRHGRTGRGTASSFSAQYFFDDRPEDFRVAGLAKVTGEAAALGLLETSATADGGRSIHITRKG